MRTVIVTGAAGGLGSSLVADLAADHRVFATCHTKQPPAELMRRKGLHWVSANLTDPGQVAALAKETGTPWAVINLAGVTYSAMHWKADPTDEANTIEGNLAPLFNVCRAYSALMRKNFGPRAGRIVNVSSIVAHTGAVGASCYAAAKSAIEGYTRSIALELAPSSITANCIALGYMDAGMIDRVPAEAQNKIRGEIPARRFGEPADLAGLVRYLISDASSYMTGQTLHLNGGLRLG